MNESQKFELVFNSELPYFNQINTAELKEIIYNEFLEQELIPCLKLYRLNFYSDDDWNEIVRNNLAEEKGNPIQFEFHRLAMRNELDDKFYIHNINKCPSIIALNQIKDNYDVFCNSFKKEQHQKVKVITQSIFDLLNSIDEQFTKPVVKYLISENKNIPLNVCEISDNPIDNIKRKKDNWKEFKIEFNNTLNKHLNYSNTIPQSDVLHTDKITLVEEKNNVSFKIDNRLSKKIIKEIKTKNLINDNEIELLRDLFNGVEINSKINFNVKQNQITELFKRIKYNKYINCKNSSLAQWLVSNFKYYNTEFETFEDLNFDSVLGVLKNINREPKKNKIIEIEELPFLDSLGRDEL